jgi:hypothetical protein
VSMKVTSSELNVCPTGHHHWGRCDVKTQVQIVEEGRSVICGTVTWGRGEGLGREDEEDVKDEDDGEGVDLEHPSSSVLVREEGERVRGVEKRDTLEGGEVDNVTRALDTFVSSMCFRVCASTCGLTERSGRLEWSI